MRPKTSLRRRVLAGLLALAACYAFASPAIADQATNGNNIQKNTATGPANIETAKHVVDIGVIDLAIADNRTNVPLGPDPAIPRSDVNAANHTAIMITARAKDDGGGTARGSPTDLHRHIAKNTVDPANIDVTATTTTTTGTTIARAAINAHGTGINNTLNSTNGTNTASISNTDNIAASEVAATGLLA